MDIGKSVTSLSNGNSAPARLDEIPKKPPVPVTQKIILYDVSDISQISDISGKAISEISPMNYNLPNAKNSYPSITNFPQMQLNAAELTDHAIPKQSLQPFHHQAATIQQKNPSDLSNAIVELNKSSKLELTQSTDPSVPILWECLKKQDEKWNALQEQIAQILEQKAVPCPSNPKTALVPSHGVHDVADCVVSQKESPVSSPRNRTMVETCTLRNRTSSENRENTQLLNCLQAQTEQILKLQEQNQKLLEQNMKLLEEKQQLQDCNQELKCKLLFAGKRKLLDKPERACENEQPTVHQSMSVKENTETAVKKVHKSAKPKTNVGYREEKEIEKTSTSTMTSLIYDGSDKVVYQKLTTVTTESKKQCSEISAQCPSKNKESFRTPENRSTPKDPASSSRKKIGKCRKCGKCSPRNTKSPHSNSLNSSKNGCKMTPESVGKTGCGTLQTCEEEIQVHNADSERIMVPRYENILRNVNELNLNCNEVGTTPRLRPVLKPSSKERKKNTPTRPVDLSPKTENLQFRRKSSSSASNTSTDSSSSSNCSIQEISPKKLDTDSKLQESTAISIYGLSSPNLSKDTRRYLENFGLTRDRQNFSKSRTTLVKRYLR
ncbi:hypothetical protein JTE90_009177 [Oedothorax gibbosus]|uniref:Uncharacterized protein n=1 Tax=Oedothorax gibbosus TaxID=931172 RepID=A0AAV6UYI5_9ARAC|nr:hypothetical protein JTE90_009177 [Oedothorax gibbosus]